MEFLSTFSIFVCTHLIEFNLMKKSILLSAVICLFAFSGMAQNNHRVDEASVPKPAVNSFHAKFSDVKVLYWEMEGNDYEVMFIQNGAKMEAIFNNEGAWIETETWLKEEELPSKVIAALTTSHLEKWKISTIEMISMPKDKEFYEIDLVQGEIKSQIYYDHNGKILADDRWIDEDVDDLMVELDEDMDGTND